VPLPPNVFQCPLSCHLCCSHDLYQKVQFSIQSVIVRIVITGMLKQIGKVFEGFILGSSTITEVTLMSSGMASFKRFKTTVWNEGTVMVSCFMWSVKHLHCQCNRRNRGVRIIRSYRKRSHSWQNRFLYCNAYINSHSHSECTCFIHLTSN